MTIVLINNNKEELIIIPNEAIRVRVIANSNKKEDIKEKEVIKDNLNTYMNKLLRNKNNYDEVRTTIKSNLNNINEVIENTIEDNNYNETYKVNYGLNLFPEKEFNGIIYPSGYYESLVVTLGEGKGPNYWCVLYPPLCLIEEQDKPEYKLFIKEVLDKYL